LFICHGINKEKSCYRFEKRSTVLQRAVMVAMFDSVEYRV